MGGACLYMYLYLGRESKDAELYYSVNQKGVQINKWIDARKLGIVAITKWVMTSPLLIFET